MPDESICWMVTQHFNDEISRDNFQLSVTLTQSEWGPDKMNTMCDQVKTFPIPCGALYARPSLVVGDLIAATQEDKISRVMLEEKLFETWSFGRTVLMGDGKLLVRYLRADVNLYDVFNIIPRTLPTSMPQGTGSTSMANILRIKIWLLTTSNSFSLDESRRGSWCRCSNSGRSRII